MVISKSFGSQTAVIRVLRIEVVCKLRSLFGDFVGLDFQSVAFLFADGGLQRTCLNQQIYRFGW
ncbi:MAG: hypothetical protein ACYSU5_14690 [Planctomycetota bacterium]